jgi:hypothetical protein
MGEGGDRVGTGISSHDTCLTVDWQQYLKLLPRPGIEQGITDPKLSVSVPLYAHNNNHSAADNAG